jgi:Holliday junction resolvase RusA-like endonuclease
VTARAPRREPEMLQIWVPGRPVPQGSMIPGFGKSVRSANADRLKPWRAVVSTAAVDAPGPSFIGPVAVTLEFAFRRPKGHYRTGRNLDLLSSSATTAPATRGQGDLDKLTRAVFDGLTDSGRITDDALIVSLLASKRWADGRNGAEGCRIRVVAA